MSLPDTSRPISRDALFMLPRDRTVANAHQLLRPVNMLQPEEMVGAIAVLFSAICSRVQLDPEEVHKLGMKLLRDQQHHDKTNKSLQSMRDFAGMRIAGQEVSIS